MDANNTQWQYTPGQGETPGQPNATPQASNPAGQAQPESAQGGVTWAAAEFIEHERDASWYLLLFLATVALAASLYFLTKDYFAVGTIVVLGIIIGVLAGRKPKQINYEVSKTGIRIGDKSYAYGLFRSFFVVREGQLNSINLVPLKRFMPPVSAYYAPADEERIVGTLSEHMPYEERQLDVANRLARRLRF